MYLYDTMFHSIFTFSISPLVYSDRYARTFGLKVNAMGKWKVEMLVVGRFLVPGA